MAAKNKILKTFHVTPAQAVYLNHAGIKNLSEYIRSLIKADKPDFPDDMPPQGDIERIPERKKK